MVIDGLAKGLLYESFLSDTFLLTILLVRLSYSVFRVCEPKPEDQEMILFTLANLRHKLLNDSF